MELYQFRIKKSNETFEEAKTLCEKFYFTGTINRLYYSLFYAASAALLKIGIKTKTHAGTKSQFHKTFIKTGLLPLSIGELYDYLFEARQEVDYGDFATVSKDDTERLMNDTQEIYKLILNFIPTIER